jgi:hypothetical protein
MQANQVTLVTVKREGRCIALVAMAWITVHLVLWLPVLFALWLALFLNSLHSVRSHPLFVIFDCGSGLDHLLLGTLQMA